MIPVTVPGKRGKTTVVDRDECVRPESTMETLGRLPTAFEPDGVCTAGNSSPMSDGAGAVVLMDRETAEKMKAYHDGLITNLIKVGKALERF